MNVSPYPISLRDSIVMVVLLVGWFVALGNNKKLREGGSFRKIFFDNSAKTLQLQGLRGLLLQAFANMFCAIKQRLSFD